MKMGVCAHLGGQKRFLCEIRGFNSDFGDFFFKHRAKPVRAETLLGSVTENICFLRKANAAKTVMGAKP